MVTGQPWEIKQPIIDTLTLLSILNSTINKVDSLSVLHLDLLLFILHLSPLLIVPVPSCQQAFSHEVPGEVSAHLLLHLFCFPQFEVLEFGRRLVLSGNKLNSEPEGAFFIDVEPQHLVEDVFLEEHIHELSLANFPFLVPFLGLLP